jgi:hypothetical protein
MKNLVLKSMIVLAGILSASTNYASTLVYAEGNVFTNRPSAEYIVLQVAQRRMVSDARSQCRNLGFTNEPNIVGEAFCSASYANRAWSAQCGADFDCE